MTKPVLRPEEWARYEGLIGVRTALLQLNPDQSEPEFVTFALANASLPCDHPRKISRQMVDSLMACVDLADGLVAPRTTEAAREALARLRALLPP